MTPPTAVSVLAGWLHGQFFDADFPHRLTERPTGDNCDICYSSAAVILELARADPNARLVADALLTDGWVRVRLTDLPGSKADPPRTEPSMTLREAAEYGNIEYQPDDDPPRTEP